MNCRVTSVLKVGLTNFLLIVSDILFEFLYFFMMRAAFSVISSEEVYQLFNVSVQSLLNTDNTLSNESLVFLGRVPNFSLSDSRKQSFLATDWLKFGTLPQKCRTL